MKSLLANSFAQQLAFNGVLATLAGSQVFTGTGQGAVLSPGWEMISQPIYDYEVYSTAGYTSQQFFQRSGGSANVGYDVTNMPAPGAFPRGQMFMVDSLEVDYISNGLPLLTAQTEASPPGASQINDMYSVMNAGWLNLTINAKPYLNCGQLKQFPPSVRVSGVAALSDATTAAGSQRSQYDLAAATGETFQLLPFLLQESVNFVVSVNFSTAIPVRTAARLGVTMNGVLFRRYQ